MNKRFVICIVFASFCCVAAPHALAQAQPTECHLSKGIAAKLWKAREAAVTSRYNAGMTKPAEDKPSGFNFWVTDRIGFDASYGDTNTLEAGKSQVVFVNDDDRADFKWNFTYKLAFGDIRKRYFVNSVSATPAPDAALAAATIEQARLAFSDLVGQWHKANIALEISKQEALLEMDAGKRKLADLKVQSALATLSDLTNRLGILSGDEALGDSLCQR